MKIGLQMFSLMKVMQQEDGLRKALRYAAEAGYDGVEFAGFYGLTPEEIKAELDKNGLEAAGLHVGWAPVKLEDLENNTENVLRIAKILGLQSITVASYGGQTREDWIAFSERINRIGETFRENGIPLGYHNHRSELKPLPAEPDSEKVIDIFLNLVKSENVFWELDTRHVVVARQDPVEFAKKYAGRIPFVHAHDAEKLTGDDTALDCAVGYGIVDNKTCIEVSGEHKWLIVEESPAETIEQSLSNIRMSQEYLRKHFG